MHDQRTNDEEAADFERVIHACEQAVMQAAPDSADRPRLLLELANRLRDRYSGTGNPSDLERAVELCEQANGLALPDSPVAPALLRGLGSALRDRFLLTDDAADLDRGIELCDRAALRSAYDSDDRPSSLHELGMGLYHRHARAEMPDDLIRAVEVLKQALALTTTGSPDRPRYTQGLVLALWERHMRTGDPADLTLVTDLCTRLLTELPASSSDRPMSLYYLSLAAWQRYAIGPDQENLDEAIEVHERAAREVPPDWPDWPTCMRSLAEALRERYVQMGGVADLTRAADIYTQLVEHEPVGLPDRPLDLSNLAGVLRDRYVRKGDRADLDRAIQLGELALAESVPDRRGRAEFAHNLGINLQDRSSYAGAAPEQQLADLGRAAGLYEQAVACSPLGSPSRPGYISDLANALWEYQGQSGQKAVLDRVIGLSEEALAETPADSPNRTLLMYNLGMRLLQRDQSHGDGVDLERAIEAFDSVLAQAPADAPERAASVVQSGHALLRRFSRNADKSDLERVIRADQEALDWSPANSPHVADLQNQLAGALLNRYYNTKDRADLDRTIELQEAGLARAPAGSPTRTQELHWLALGLQARYRDAADPADLVRAIKIFEEVVTHLPLRSSDWQGASTNLAQSLQDLYERDHQRKDLDRAIRILEQLLAQAPPGSPDRRQLLDTLGRALLRRYRATGNHADLVHAIAQWEEAWSLLQATFATLSVAYKLGQQRLWSPLYARLVSLHIEWAETCTEKADSDDAYRRAMVVAESAKSRLLTDMVGRADIPVPPAISEPAARERELLADLTAWDTQTLATAEEPGAAGQSGHARMLTPQERQQRIDELRELWSAMELEGEEAADYVALRRGDSLSWEDLVELATKVGAESTLLSLFVDADFTALFILRTGWDTPAVVKVSLGAARWEDTQRRLYREVARSFGSTTLEQTWDTQLQRLLEQVTPHVAGTSRLVVAPMAAGHLLPWNVLAERAGWRSPDGPVPDVALMPALGLLSRLERRPPRDIGPIIVVGNPGGDLRYAEEEAREIAAIFGTEALIGSAATTERVLADIGTAAIIHLAAHASFVRQSPLHSGIVLADDVLTTAQVMQTRLQAEVLVLSGCETGVVDVQGGDELVGLTGAFLQAGARGLVVSLWTVDDESTAALMTAFYAARQDGADAARALRLAMDKVLASGRWSHPYYWGAFSFVGAWQR